MAGMASATRTAATPTPLQEGQAVHGREARAQPQRAKAGKKEDAYGPTRGFLGRCSLLPGSVGRCHGVIQTGSVFAAPRPILPQPGAWRPTRL